MLVVVVKRSHSKSKNRLGKIQRMWRVIAWKSVSSEGER